MRVWQLVFGCILLSLCRADPSFTVTNSMLDPNRITWWRTKWASAPVLLSVNNQFLPSSATFFFSPTTSMTAGVFEVTFPVGFTIADAEGQSFEGQVVQVPGQTYIGGVDYAVTVKGLTNPSTHGAYGPFALRTRFSSSGQQVDVNLSFGSVYISYDASPLQALDVSLAGTTVNNVVNKNGNTLSFEFILGVSLWRYDTFVITTDSRWTVDSGATCSSANFAGRYNNFNGTNIANPHQLDCVITPQYTFAPVPQVIYIYGLAVNEVDLAATAGNVYVDLRVTNVTTPNATFDWQNPFSWTVSTTRFGTTTILETAMVMGEPILTTDVIDSASWTPTWGTFGSDLPSGSSVFMDLSFPITNSIPANGAIQISVTEDVSTGDANWVSLGTAGNCYVVTFLDRSVLCETSLHTITLTALPELYAGTVIVVRNVVKVVTTAGGTAKINEIKTYKSSVTANIAIDQGTNLSPISVINTNVLTTFSLQFQTRTDTIFVSPKASYTGGTGDNTQTLQFSIVPHPISDLTDASVFTINCPFSASISDFAIGVPSASFFLVDSSIISTINVDSQTPISVNSPVLTAGSDVAPGSITFTGVLGHTSGEQLFLYQSSSVLTDFITLPRIENNLATIYECSINIETNNKNSQRSAFRFQVHAQDWTDAFFDVPCTDNVDGLPGIFTLKPGVFSVPSSSETVQYYVEIQVTAVPNFNSGLNTMQVDTPNNSDVLSFSTPYPVDTSVGENLEAFNYVIGTENYVAVTLLPELSPTATSGYVLYIPLGGLPDGPVTPTARSFYVLSADPRYKFVMHEEELTTQTLVHRTAALFHTSSVVGDTGIQINGSRSGSGLILDLSATVAIDSWFYLYFVLSTGFSWSQYAEVMNLVVGTVYSKVFYFSSPSSTFKFPGVLIYSNIALPTTSSVTGTIQIGGFGLPLGAGTTSFKAVLGPAQKDGACVNGAIFPFISTTGTITSLMVLPTVVPSRGPDGIGIQQIVMFVLQHGIPLGGSINMIFASDWTSTENTYCEAQGEFNKSVCTTSGNSVVVTGLSNLSTVSPLEVKIAVSNLITPYTTTDNTDFNFVIALSSTTGSALIDELASNAGSKVLVKLTTPIGHPVWTTVKTYPMIVGTHAVDLYLKFSLPHELPLPGVITLSSPLAFLYTGKEINNCFLSPLKYTNCSMSGNNLQITLGEEYPSGTVLELYLDAAVNNPANTVTTTTGFSLTSTWGGVTVDEDTTDSAKLFTALPTRTNALTFTSLTFAPLTTGEVANYTFIFKDTCNFGAGDQYWIVFPPQFDYFLGDVWTPLLHEPDTYYIDCSSTQLEATCTVDHRVVVVQGKNSVVGTTAITITITGVVNPSAVQTSLFEIYHVDSTGDFLAVNQNFGTVTPTDFAANLDVRSLVQTDNRLFQSSNYTWRLYISDTIDTATELQVLFPQEFDLELFEETDYYQCGSTWLDDSTTATVKAEQYWNLASYCPAGGNRVTLPAPTLPITFTHYAIVTWTLQNVTNTQWGRDREPYSPYTDFDIQDSALWPIASYWVSKFTFFVFNSGLKYTSRSYPNMNAAYAGFDDGYKSLYVNNYNPSTKANRIVVYAGTQTTDLWITTASAGQPMASKQVILTPVTNARTPDNGMLNFTSALDNWTLFESFWQIRFRVSAAIDLSKGLYYIDWSTNETTQTGLEDVQYDRPVSTLVEVIGKDAGLYSFSVPSIPSIVLGSTSIPIPISIRNAPHTNVTVTISVSENTNITVDPTSFGFSPDVNTMYFQIIVPSSYDLTLGSVQVVTFTLSGVDSYVYSIGDSAKFQIIEPTSFSPGNILIWGLGIATKTTETAYPVTDKVGVIYYQFSATGSLIPDYYSLKSSVGQFGSLNYSSQSNETDPEPGETWTDFQWRLYRTHLEQVWVGSIVMPSTNATAPLIFDWLYAGTDYQLAGYLDNLAPETPSLHIEYFTTAVVADCQPVTIGFTELVDESFSPAISQAVAYALGVNPLRLYNSSYTTFFDTTGFLISSNFTYILVPNRFSESPDPSTQVLMAVSAYTDFIDSLNATGILNNSVTFSYGGSPLRVTPAWNVVPTYINNTSNSVIVSLSSNTPGQICCIAVTSFAEPPAEKVMLGLDANNYVTSGTCITSGVTNDTDLLEVSNLEQGMNYTVFCTATDDYPLWPTQMNYSISAPMKYVNASTYTACVSPCLTCDPFYPYICFSCYPNVTLSTDLGTCASENLQTPNYTLYLENLGRSDLGYDNTTNTICYWYVLDNTCAAQTDLLTANSSLTLPSDLTTLTAAELSPTLCRALLATELPYLEQMSAYLFGTVDFTGAYTTAQADTGYALMFVLQYYGFFTVSGWTEWVNMMKTVNWLSESCQDGVISDGYNSTVSVPDEVVALWTKYSQLRENLCWKTFP